jgi:beta-lactamase regulating signal transducer with metallopeptidase domain
MMLAWMVYVLVVTAILAAAAFAAERSAQIRKASTRWLWVASICASLVLPVVISSVSIQVPSLTSAVGQTAPQKLIPLRQMTSSAIQPSAWLGAGTQRRAAAPDVDTILARAWAGASGLLFLAILFSGAQLYRRKRDWERQVMAGAAVFVSEDVGPAIVGLLRPHIVVPRWIIHATAETQGLVLAHEQSHLDAKDAQLLAVAILLIVAMPWNLPLWWQLRRLRFAIEVDCDTRVLKIGHDASRYGETLIMVGERQSNRIAVVAAMSESKSFLEQRIRTMLRKQKKFAWASASAMAGLGFVLAASAAEVSPPNVARLSAGLLQVSGSSAADAGQIGGMQMKHYKNSEWNFGLELPARWNAFPPVPTNSPAEVIRFVSDENGNHNLIIFREPYDPQVSPEIVSQRVQESLAKSGFSHFVSGETRIGSRRVLTLDFDKIRPDGVVWNCRHYFVIDGTLMYVLGFGTTDRKAMFGVYDQMAKSFTFGDVTS